MLKTLTGLLLSVLTASAFAAGPYDAIYQSSTSASTYAAVHQNGGNVIIAIYDSRPSNGSSIDTRGGTIVPPKLNFWDVFSGPIAGSVTTVTGQHNYGGCVQTVDVVFSDTGFTATVTADAPTPAGITAGLNCTTGVGSSGLFVKVW